MKPEQTSDSGDLVVGGFIPLTTTDLPDRLSAVVFCQGCPWQCAYCHNPHLIPPTTESSIPWGSILSFLERRKGLLDGVVFSGGEPTMQPGLPSAIKVVKEMGFQIGLHTAGQYPERLKMVLPLLTWVGMDIKAPFGKSDQITGRPVHEMDRKLRESASLIINSGVQYEFRTTVHPTLLNESGMVTLATDLQTLGARQYVIQEFRPTGCTNPTLNSSPPVPGAVSKLAQIVGGKFDQFEFRPANGWLPSAQQ